MPTLTASAAPRVLLPTPGARVAGLLGAAALLALCGAASLAVGSQDVPLRDVVRALSAFDASSDAQVIVRELRVPRTEVGLLVGAALGAAGALMQGVTRNPLAEPGILGVNAGAALAVVLAISVLGVADPSGYAAFALLGAGASAVLVFLLGSSGARGPTPVALALAGVVLGALLVALTSAVLVFDARTLDEFRFWIVGSIAGRDAGIALAVLPLVLLGLGLALTAGRRLNALALGDEVARSLGQRVGRARASAGLAVVLLAGGAVAAAGPIAFVGLAVPHVARALVGPDYRWIVPYSILGGAILLLATDVVGRVLARPAELEVGIVTALLGAPFFVWLVRRGRLAAL